MKIHDMQRFKTAYRIRIMIFRRENYLLKFIARLYSCLDCISFALLHSPQLEFE